MNRAQPESGLQRLIARARDFAPAAHVPLYCSGQRIGWLRETAALRLLDYRNVFERDGAGVHLLGALATPEMRTSAVGEVIAMLYREGTISGWRDERYAVVTDFNAPPLFHIERAAARYLGVTTYAAHANGYCSGSRGCEMWIARRSSTKPIDPDLLDNLIGGGMSAGVPPLQTLIREAWEEAGIPETLARSAVAAGRVQVLRQVPEGVQSDVIFAHDLELPGDFQPCNQDGEVKAFQRVPVSSVIEMLIGGADITLDAGLVMLGFLIRRKHLQIGGKAVAQVLYPGH